MLSKKELSTLLINYRQAKKLKQNQLAKIIGISESVLSNIELCGNSEPNVRTKLRLIEYFNLNPTELLTENQMKKYWSETDETISSEQVADFDQAEEVKNVPTLEDLMDESVTIIKKYTEDNLSAEDLIELLRINVNRLNGGK